jgi:hypothetical protein
MVACRPETIAIADTSSTSAPAPQRRGRQLRRLARLCAARPKISEDGALMGSDVTCVAARADDAQLTVLMPPGFASLIPC